MDVTITEQEVVLLRRLIHRLAGINLSAEKKTLLVGRLSRRLHHFRYATFSEYYRLLASGSAPDEVQTFIDLLTTNETYFFRESQHFDLLRDIIIPERGASRPFRIWSGACSSGEEPYTMAMVLAEHLPGAPWEVFASDISQTVLARAQAGVYPLERATGIPAGYLHKYCMKGVRSQQGKLLVAPELRQRVRFAQVNLTEPIVGAGDFDVIFLRNVMIYFDADTKRKVIEHMMPCLKPDGYFIVGHSESLNGIPSPLKSLRPTVYRKPA
jgi:chemotaxis protein methyltransferase CheR